LKNFCPKAKKWWASHPPEGFVQQYSTFNSTAAFLNRKEKGERFSTSILSARDHQAF
jgi:hypothetical protein